MPANDAPTADPLGAVLSELRAIRTALEAPPSEPALLLGATAAAALCGLSRSSFFRGVSAGELPAPVASPSGPRWRRADIIKWCERLKATKR